MMFYVAAVLALSVAPVYSFSYLESLTGATPVTASSVDIAPPVPVAAADTEAPFFLPMELKIVMLIVLHFSSRVDPHMFL